MTTIHFASSIRLTRNVMILTDVRARRVRGPGDCCRCGVGIVEFGGRAAIAAAAAAAVATRAVVTASAVVVVISTVPRLTAQRGHVARRTTVLHTAYN